jgi:hypothetical protein
MPKERRASHEEDRECRQADVRHCIVAITRRTLALVGKTGADLAQLPDQLLNGAHPALELMIESAHKRKPLHAVGISQQIHNMWYIGLVIPRTNSERDSFALRTAASPCLNFVRIARRV